MFLLRLHGSLFMHDKSYGAPGWNQSSGTVRDTNMSGASLDACSRWVLTAAFASRLYVTVTPRRCVAAESEADARMPKEDGCLSHL